MKSKIILIIVISSLIIGCIDTTKIPGMTKSQPCIQTTSQNGGSIGTISQGDCSESQLSGLSPDEQKLIGTWKIDTNIMKGSFTFNSDKTGTFSTQLYGNIFFNWKASNGRLHTDIQTYSMFEPNGVQYKIVNNDKTLDFSGMYFEKSWW